MHTYYNWKTQKSKTTWNYFKSKLMTDGFSIAAKNASSSTTWTRLLLSTADRCRHRKRRSIITLLALFLCNLYIRDAGNYFGARVAASGFLSDFFWLLIQTLKTSWNSWGLIRRFLQSRQYTGEFVFL